MTVRLSRCLHPLVAAMLQVLAFPLLAAEPLSPVPATSYTSFLQMLLALGIVLATIAAMAWLLRRLSPGQVGTAGELRVVAAVAVGPKERVVLVDVGDTRLVLGVTSGQVNRLMEMPRPEYVEPSPMTTPPFVRKLKDLIAARGGTP